MRARFSERSSSRRARADAGAHRGFARRASFYYPYAATHQPRRFKKFSRRVVRALVSDGVKSGMCVPLVSRNRALGTINVGSLRDHAFGQEDLDLLTQIANQIAIAVENALAYQQIAELKDKLSEEKLYLEDEIRTEYNFEEIIGESPALKRVLEQLQTVAPTDSTILVLGETGTGKELIARAIHNLS